MNEKVWYAGIGGEQKGPFDAEEVRAFASKVSAAELMVWKAGFEAWKPALDVKELGISLPALAPPPLPPVSPIAVGPPSLSAHSPMPPPVPTGSVRINTESATVFFKPQSQQMSQTNQAHSQPQSAQSSTGSSSGTLTPTAGPTGQTFGKYRIISEVARGGMGIVYTAKQEGLDRVVALKVLLQGKFSDQEQVQRFFQEARAAAKLSHPNIVPIFDMGEFSGQNYYTMEYIEGQSLDKILDRRPLDARTAAQVALSIAQGLQAAHQAGIIHRDIKPSNVLVKTMVRSGRLSSADWEQAETKVMDFGLAGNIGGEKSTKLTMDRAVMGTPHYMSPEQARGEIDTIDQRSDIYSLGALLYEMIAGAPPCANIPFHDVIALTANAKEAVPKPSTIARSIDPVIEIICMKAMRKDPASRYRNAAEMSADLERYLKGEKIKAKAAGFFERRGMRLGRVAAVVALGLTVVGVAAGWYLTRPGVLKPLEINWMDAQKHIGEQVTIEIPVLKTFKSDGKVTLSPKPGDKTAFEGWIMAENFGAFPAEFDKLYWMKLVRATGKLEKNSDRPVLRLTGASDIEVIRPLRGKERGDAAQTGQAALTPSADNLIPWKKAMDSLDKIVTVEGQVIDAKRNSNAVNFIFSNSEADFRVDCWNDAWENFPPEFENLYKGKTIWVTGKIASNKGRPIIKMYHPNQIKIVANVATTDAAAVADTLPTTGRAGRPRTR